MQDPANMDIGYRLTFRDVVELLKLVRESEPFESFSLEVGELKLSVTRAAASAPPRADAVAPAVPLRPALPPEGEAPPAAGGAATPEPAGLVTVRAPLLGTFYRAPAPGAAPFVEVGDTVSEADTIGLIEVMKLFTPITAGAAGRVAEIVAQNAALVEYGEPLLRIEPLPAKR
jgi:acetyl-CoA carboxylase biotin carboxyl carrier protein